MNNGIKRVTLVAVEAKNISIIDYISERIAQNGGKVFWVNEIPRAQ